MTAERQHSAVVVVVPTPPNVESRIRVERKSSTVFVRAIGYSSPLIADGGKVFRILDTCTPQVGPSDRAAADGLATMGREAARRRLVARDA